LLSARHCQHDNLIAPSIVLISALCVYYPADVSGKSHMKSSQRCVVRSSMKVDPQAKRRRRIPSCDPSVDRMLLEMPDQDRHIPSQNTFTPGGLPDVRNRKSEPGSSYQLYPAKTHDDRQASEEAAPIVPFRQQIPSGDTEWHSRTKETAIRMGRLLWGRRSNR
jgi:hypothetical protein